MLASRSQSFIKKWAIYKWKNNFPKKKNVSQKNCTIILMYQIKRIIYSAEPKNTHKKNCKISLHRYRINLDYQIINTLHYGITKKALDRVILFSITSVVCFSFLFCIFFFFKWIEFEIMLNFFTQIEIFSCQLHLFTTFFFFAFSLLCLSCV